MSCCCAAGEVVPWHVVTFLLWPRRSVGEAVEEIAEYVTDADATVARAAVSAIGKMGVKVPACGDVVVDQLMKFLEVDIDHVTAEAIISMRNLLRKYPDFHTRIIHGVGAFLKKVDEPEAKVALLWMVAEYGAIIPESPYLVEPLIDAVSEEESQARPPTYLRTDLLADALTCLSTSFSAGCAPRAPLHVDAPLLPPPRRDAAHARPTPRRGHR